ncbi:hypothetical protein L202_06430 [Cryptococcus amylolentus CBS 6039]|uniref:Glutamyl-tRNA(Gln) amidotransferase subunit A, mitochondrial n=1 Tax=Cryptococcus amylolentus CBS 6039 TaxID=1295533 RepID=A0A1E3HFW0_9TREE|nr:hypothetical protein L202_06430 [Cryptococcus amylolentus CBS 6039]ODN75238.1 hypothetical protein L202_06430 [Cryptococcus amylolentus CBS 6039]
MRPSLRSLTHGPYAWRNPSPATGPSGLLAGKHIAIKENISYSQAPTSCSSQLLQGYIPPYNATCVDDLINAGAHIMGTTKMDEFGMGSQTTNIPPSYSPVHNPCAPSPDEPPRSAGGSSGGSATAVAEGSCWAALGTDTGGSVRLPASYCGVVGLKPSYGLVSRRGVVAYGDSLDCVGVLAKDIDIVTKVFNIISHPDDRDMTCAPSSVRSTSLPLDLSSTSLKYLRIGIPAQTLLPHPYTSIPPSLLTHLQSLGASLRPVSLPSVRKALPAYYVLASAEASSNLGRYGGGWYGSEGEKEEGRIEGESGQERRVRVRSDGFGKEVKKRILAGTHALSADEFNNTYLKALYLRRLLRQEYQRTFRIAHPLAAPYTPNSDGVDLILHPTAIRTAPLLNQDAKTGESVYLQDLITVPPSLAGLPAMSVPAGKAEDGWPVGMSVTGQWGMEGLVFGLGRAIERWSRDL